MNILNTDLNIEYSINAKVNEKINPVDDTSIALQHDYFHSTGLTIFTEKDEGGIQLAFNVDYIFADLNQELTFSSKNTSSKTIYNKISIINSSYYNTLLYVNYHVAADAIDAIDKDLIDNHIINGSFTNNTSGWLSTDNTKLLITRDTLNPIKHGAKGLITKIDTQNANGEYILTQFELDNIDLNKTINIQMLIELTNALSTDFIIKLYDVTADAYIIGVSENIVDGMYLSSFISTTNKLFELHIVCNTTSTDEITLSLSEVLIGRNIYNLAESYIAEAMPVGSIQFWPWSYNTVPTGFLPMLQQTLSRTDYAKLWTIAQHNIKSDRFHFGSGNGSSTFTLPDWTGITVRGAVYKEVTIAQWDATANTIDLEYTDLPNGTPIIANVTAGGLTAGAVYYIALDSGSEYRIYNTEANANAKGATGRITITAITSPIILTSVGEFQNHAFQGHWHDFWAKVRSGDNASGYAYDGLNDNSDTKLGNNNRVRDPQADPTNGPPNVSNESRMTNVQGMWIIKVNNTLQTADETKSLDARLTDLENTLLVSDKYESDWTLCTAWTSGATITITHGLNTLFKDLDAKVYVYDPAAPTAIYDATYVDVYNTNSYGQSFRGDSTSLNSCVLQIHNGNGRIVNYSGVATNITASFYYKVVITTNKSKSFIKTVNPSAVGNPYLSLKEAEYNEIYFDDGSGPYDWEDYPELDNTAFKAILTTWSTAGWMTAYTATQFYVPDLRGMAFQIAGTSAIRQMANAAYFNGGTLAQFITDMMFGHYHSTRYYSSLGGGGTNVAPYPNNGYPLGDGGIRAPSNDGVNGPPNVGPKTKPATASIRLIVRFE